jgi:NAD(P)-dependent dehydrogenase (short-subunit alcohol dehydrogenase family)
MHTRWGKTERAHDGRRERLVDGGSSTEGLAGRRVLVVGASSGIGRAVGIAAARAGAHVALVARRYDQLETVEGEAGSNAVALQCDVRAPIACELAVQAAVQRFGGLDTVVFATGINRLALLADTSVEAWRDLFDTNVIGAALITRAVLSQLKANVGRIAYLSSHSVPSPWPALGAYAASKAALDTMIAGWRVEEPTITFTRVVVGPTITGMADDWDPTLAATMFETWDAAGYMVHEPKPPEWVAGRILEWAASTTPDDDVVLIEQQAS